MKSLLDVNAEISEIIASQGRFENKRAESRAKKRLQFLNMVKMYIESQPDEYFVAREIFRLEKRVNLLSDSFDESQYKDAREARKKYEKEVGIPDLRSQIKVLRFIKN